MLVNSAYCTTEYRFRILIISVKIRMLTFRKPLQLLFNILEYVVEGTINIKSIVNFSDLTAVNRNYALWVGPN